MSVFRIYEPHELGADGYPLVWHKLTDPDHSDLLNEADMLLPGGVKDVVRALAGHRCVRCGHPYRPGFTEWEDLPHSIPYTTAASLYAAAQGEVGPEHARRRILWSPCDERCTHPVTDDRGRSICRWRNRMGEWTTVPLNINRDAEQQAAWRILTVHHLNGRKHDLRWWNLASLCQRCHLQIQRKVVMEQVYPFEHTAWFRPYAAGWYAYAYCGEDLTREETMARLDELLALELA